MYEEYDSLDFFFFFEASFLGACGTVRPSTTAARRRVVCALSHGFVGGPRASGRVSAGPAPGRGGPATRVVERATDWHGVFSNHWDGVRSGGRLTLADFLLGVLAMLSSVCVFDCDVKCWVCDRC